MTMMMGTNTGVFRHLESNGLMGLRTDPVKEQGVVQCEAYVLGSVEARKNAYGDDVGTFPFKEGVKQIHIFRGDPLFSPSSETLRRYGVRSYANKPYVTATVNGLRLDEEISYQGVAVNSYPETAQTIVPSQLMNMQVAGSVSITNTGTEQICAGSSVMVRIPKDNNETAVVRQADSIPTRLLLETYEVPVISRTSDTIQALASLGSVAQELSFFYADPEFKKDYTALRPGSGADAIMRQMPDDRTYEDEVENNETAKLVLARLIDTLKDDAIVVNSFVQEDAQRLMGEFLDEMNTKKNERAYMNCALWMQWHIEKAVVNHLLDEISARGGARSTSRNSCDTDSRRRRNMSCPVRGSVSESDSEDDDERDTRSKADTVARMQRDELRAHSTPVRSSSTSQRNRSRLQRSLTQRRALNVTERAKLDAMAPRHKFIAHERVVTQLVTRRLMFQAESLQRLRTRNIMGLAISSGNKGALVDVNLTLRHY